MRQTLRAVLCVGLAACSDSSSGPTTLTVNTYVTSGPANAQLVAVQDGDGAWTALTGATGVYTVKLHSDHYGLLTSCATPTFGGGPAIWYATISDGTTLYFDNCDDPGTAAANISGAVTGAAPADPVSVLDAYFGEADIPAGMTSYALPTFAGPETLIAAEMANMRPIQLALSETNVVDNATVNFDLGAGFAPLTQTLSGTAIGAASLSYRDAHGITRIDHTTNPVDFRAIPAGQLGSGLNRLTVSDGNGNEVIRYFKTPSDQHVTFPQPIVLAQQPTATRVPYPNTTFVIPVQADTLYDFGFDTLNTTTSVGHGWSIEMTSAYVAKAYAGKTSFTYTAPDFRALAGWTTDFQADVGVPIDWSITTTQSTNVDWFAATPPGTMFDHDGSELKFATVSGELAAP